MKILGISGSPRKKDVSGTHKLVSTVLEASGCEYEIVSLKKMQISGCIACLGCVKDNVCKVKDDLEPIREKIVTADAFVIGAPNYYSTLNANTHAFLERWFQFRHQEGNLLWGKLGVAVGVGGSAGQASADEIEKFFLYNFIETVAKVSGQGAASCFSCGYGETCKVGLPHLLYGDGFKIKSEDIPDVEKQPKVIESAIDAGRLLGLRLKTNHDRQVVTKKMQEKMMSLLKSSV
jgi:multimeric flavodoxin WrbA